jgi:uncharacterized membrane protein YczE
MGVLCVLTGTFISTFAVIDPNEPQPLWYRLIFVAGGFGLIGLGIFTFRIPSDKS